ncbi:MAG: hypothetical protein RTU63_09040 [Candidatus Thorarchaeota archaeon]
MSKPIYEEVVENAERIFQALDASDFIRNETLKQLQRADDRELLASCTPVGAAAGAIYIACILQNLRITQSELSEISEVPVSSIRKHYILLAKGLGFYN